MGARGDRAGTGGGGGGMKTHMTFSHSDAQRRAIALALGTKRPATRVQIAQFVTGALRDADPDPNQLKLAGMEPAREA